MTREASSSAGSELETALLACAAGDESALKRIYDQEAPRLLGLAICIVRRHELAEEVLQNAFIQIWRGARSFDPRCGSARGWIYSVVRNCALELKRADSSETRSDDPGLPAIVDTSTDLVSRLPQNGGLRRGLEQLDPKRRASLILACVHGCSEPEIAIQLKVSNGTARTWVSRGLIALWKIRD
ncbi:sigma-70 family RNA polymerase sigma factor [Ensifer aridi]|uniref:sigma-70 family RNA polymerase sigma factor n=1 Tax=Ensifer aridi TaxID=1708715 RepID=UPI00047B659D|nr:sigma-70 family RNA polymerase sigma factor [Ensifer aridi]